MENRERYSRNYSAFSWKEMDIIRGKKVFVAGCGGLGGYACQTLARFGVGALTIADHDVFSESNLNRQIFATTETIGKNKAYTAKRALEIINPKVTVNACDVMLDDENINGLLEGHDIAIDCLDSVQARFTLSEACSFLEIPMVHGAIAGFYGQAANIFPKDGLLSLIYPGKHAAAGVEKKLGNPAFIPQAVSAIQCAEALKLLCGRDTVLKNCMLHIDLLNSSYEIIPLAAGNKKSPED